MSMSRTFELYGRHRVSRRDRRVMLALLSGAGNLSGYPLGRAAQVGAGSVYPLLDRLEARGYVQRQRREPGYGEDHPRFRYLVTPRGRGVLLELLGLTEYDPGEQSWVPEPLNGGSHEAQH